MLPTPRPVGAICWTCGQPGAHGSLDECLVVLRRAAPSAAGVPLPAPDPPLPDWIVVRSVPNCRIVFNATTMTQAVRWIQGAKRKRGKAARCAYWLERLSAPASTRR